MVSTKIAHILLIAFSLMNIIRGVVPVFKFLLQLLKNVVVLELHLFGFVWLGYAVDDLLNHLIDDLPNLASDNRDLELPRHSNK